jgi:hypothetical protein
LAGPFVAANVVMCSFGGGVQVLLKDGPTTVHFALTTEEAANMASRLTGLARANTWAKDERMAELVMHRTSSFASPRRVVSHLP